MRWSVHLAKEKFSELIRKSVEEPQIIIHCGEEVAVLASAETYRTLSGKKRDFKAFLLEGSDFERSREPARIVKW